MSTHYTRSDGSRVPINGMAFPHLQAATKGLEAVIFKHPERAEELAAMRARLSTLEAEFTAKVDRLKAEGFCAYGAPPAVYEMAPLGSILAGPFKTEAAMWANLIKHRESAE